jgi:alpha-tubulin suppressor-like RCC1 family protein
MFYISNYHFININATEIGYNLANFQVAVGWFLSRDTRQGQSTFDETSHLQDADMLDSASSFTTSANGRGGGARGGDDVMLPVQPVDIKRIDDYSGSDGSGSSIQTRTTRAPSETRCGSMSTVGQQFTQIARAICDVALERNAGDVEGDNFGEDEEDWDGLYSTCQEYAGEDEEEEAAGGAGVRNGKAAGGDRHGIRREDLDDGQHAGTKVVKSPKGKGMAGAQDHAGTTIVVYGDQKISSKAGDESMVKTHAFKQANSDGASPRKKAGKKAGGAVIITAAAGSDSGENRDKQALVVRAAACGQQYYAVIVDSDSGDGGGDGALYTWGMSESGRLGMGPKGPSQVQHPQIVRELQGYEVLHISCGQKHTLAIVAAKGSGGGGGGGGGGRGHRRGAGGGSGAYIKGGSAGGGRVYAWGDNRCGQLGLNVNPLKMQEFHSPRCISALKSQMTRMVSCGSHHSMALTTNGVLYSWGREKCGRLGRKTKEAEGSGKTDGTSHRLPGVVWADYIGQSSFAVQTIDPMSRTGARTMSRAASKFLSKNGGRMPNDRVAFISAGWSHSMAVMESGSLFAWGNGEDGRLGLGCHSDQWHPKQVTSMAGDALAVKQVASGYAHSLILTRGGAVFACGHNKFGQLGVGELPRPPTAQQQAAADFPGAGPEGTSTEAAHKKADDAVGAVHVGVAQSVPKVMMVGASDTTFGHKDPPVLLVPRRVQGGLRKLRVASIGSGENHCVAQTVDGRVFLWGLNQHNQCGHGEEVRQQEVPKEIVIPAQPLGTGGARSPVVAVGSSHTMLIY